MAATAVGAHVPVEIWRKNEDRFQKVFVKEKVVTQIQVDPYLQTADIDTDNNSWPKAEPKPTRFQVFKEQQSIKQPNPMQKAKAGKGKTK